MSSDCDGAERGVEFSTWVDHRVGGDANAVCADQCGGFGDHDRGCKVDGRLGDFDGDAGSRGHGGVEEEGRGRLGGELFLVLAADKVTQGQ